MPLIALKHLHAHAGNANRMPAELFAKLVSHIKRWGDYPPLIVRAHPDIADEYQILDGHHRAEALRELGESFANCEVWDADDERATLLLLTLNRLHGEDDPQKRGALFAELARTVALEEVAKLVPDDAERLSQLMRLTCEPVAMPQPVALEQMPEAVTFFLLPAQRRKVLDRLASFSRDRNEALLTALQVT
jgi:ParB-like chromosome segregation protein Spo0J